MNEKLAEKLVLYDALKIKWVIEEVYESEPKTWRSGLTYFWIHVDGDNEKYSGFVGETLLDAISEFIEGGYLDIENEESDCDEP